MEKILLPVVQYRKIMYGGMFCFSFCFTSRQVRNGDDPDAQTSKHKFQTEQKLGKHDLPGNRSQKVAASHILYYYTKYIFNFIKTVQKCNRQIVCLFV
jgi:hypothetical protein